MSDPLALLFNTDPLPFEWWKNIEKEIKEISKTATNTYNQRGEFNNNYGRKHTDETKRKISIAAKARLIHSRLGKKHSEEAKLKMSLAKRGKKVNRTSPPWNKGLKTPPEVIEKIRRAKILRDIKNGISRKI